MFRKVFNKKILLLLFLLISFVSIKPVLGADAPKEKSFQQQMKEDQVNGRSTTGTGKTYVVSGNEVPAGTPKETTSLLTDGIKENSTMLNGVKVNATAIRPQTPCSFSFMDGKTYYCMLAPVPIFVNNTVSGKNGETIGRVEISAEGLTIFLNNLVKFALGIATALTVIMIVFGGVQYVSTDAINDKTEGKERIKQALSGLFLALLAYVILNTINPLVFDTSLDLGKDIEFKPIGLEATGTSTNPALPSGYKPIAGSASGQLNDGGSAQPRTSGNTDGLPARGMSNATLNNELGIGVEPTNEVIQDPNGNSYVGGNGSTFGGPKDADGGKGAKQLPLVPGKTALDLDTSSYYVAFRWDYSRTSAATLRSSCVEVYIPSATTGKKYFIAKPVDWGPGIMSRNVDISPGIEMDAGIDATTAKIYIRLVSC